MPSNIGIKRQMLKILLDNNAIDKLQQNIDFIKEYRHRLDIYVPRSVMGEACENKSYNPTWNVISLLKADVKYLPDAVFVLGYTLLDGESCFSSDEIGEVYDNILNQNKSKIADAVIGATAVANDCILITEDKKLYNKMKKFGYKVMNFAELQETITSLHDIN